MSLRARLHAWYGGTLAVCLVAYSVGAAIVLSAHMEADLERRVHEDVELVARSLLPDGDRSVSWRGGMPPPEVDEEPGGGHWFEVWSLAGEMLLSGGTQAPVPLGGAPGRDEAEHVARRLELPSGPVRVLTERVAVAGRNVLVRVAVSEVSARAHARRLRLELVALTAGVLALGGAGSWFLSRRALRPLSRMAERARRITAEQLHERLPATGDVDLDVLGSAMNDTLARLERSFESLRRFTADASHELRTPLTALRTVGEVGLRGSRDAGGYREVIGSMLEEVDRLTRLVDELLALARADAGEARLKSEPVDLSELAREVGAHLSVLAEERRQDLRVSAPGRVVLRGDRTALRQALVNLIDNAIKYSPEGSRIDVATGQHGGAAMIAVTDEGPGIAAEHQPRVFDRFYRVDKGRSREMGGTGLGLSLVKWTAEAHGGRVELSSGEGKGATFRILLPLTAPPGSS